MLTEVENCPFISVLFKQPTTCSGSSSNVCTQWEGTERDHCSNLQKKCFMYAYIGLKLSLVTLHTSRNEIYLVLFLTVLFIIIRC